MQKPSVLFLRVQFLQVLVCDETEEINNEDLVPELNFRFETVSLKFLSLVCCNGVG